MEGAPYFSAPAKDLWEIAFPLHSGSCPRLKLHIHPHAQTYIYIEYWTCIFHVSLPFYLGFRIDRSKRSIKPPCPVLYCTYLHIAIFGTSCVPLSELLSSHVFRHRCMPCRMEASDYRRTSVIGTKSWGRIPFQEHHEMYMRSRNMVLEYSKLRPAPPLSLHFVPGGIEEQLLSVSFARELFCSYPSRKRKRTT